MDSEFSGLVRQRRSQLGLSQARLAELVGRSASAVRSWERGTRRPNDPELVSALAAILGIEESRLLRAAGLTEEASAPPPAEDAVALPFDAEEDDQAAWEALSAQVTGRPAPDLQPDGSLQGGSSEVDSATAVAPPADDRGDAVSPAAEEVGVPSGEPPVGSSDGLAAVGEEVGVSSGEPPAGPGAPVPSAPEPTGGVPAGESDPAPAPADEETAPTTATAVPASAPAPADEETAPTTATAVPVSVAAADVPAWPREPVPGTAGLTDSASGEAARTQLASPVSQTVPAASRGEPSYLEDPRQMATYWVRTALTVAIGLALLIIFVWAAGKLGDSLSGVWELFKNSPPGP